MAFCENCGNQVSDQAIACPQCGHPGPAARRAPAGAVTAARRTSGAAIASLVLGVAGLIVCPLICSVLAVVYGAQARRELEADATLEGAPMAKAGTILGWIGIVVSLLGLLVFAVAFSSTSLS